jgi:hypothetical protein
MKQESLESLRKLLVGGALVATLALAGTAPAHAASGTASPGLWGWLAGLWGERIAVPWIGTGQAQGGHRPTGSPTGWEKVGSCVDPNGCAQDAAGTSGSACSLRGYAGVCLNPRG